jgi:hypothetical protein
VAIGPLLDGHPLSRPRAQSGQAEPACLCRRDRGASGPGNRGNVRAGLPENGGEFLPAVLEGQVGPQPAIFHLCDAILWRLTRSGSPSIEHQMKSFVPFCVAALPSASDPARGLTVAMRCSRTAAGWQQNASHRIRHVDELDLDAEPPGLITPWPLR